MSSKPGPSAGKEISRSLGGEASATMPPIEYVPPLSPRPADPEKSELPRDERGGAAVVSESCQPASWRGRGLKWVRRHPVLAGVLTLLGLGLAAGYAVTYRAYRTAEARRLDAERADRDRQAALRQEQAALVKARKETAKADAERQEEARQRRRAEAERERSQIALYAGQLADAQRLLREGEGAKAAIVLDRCRSDPRHWEWRYLRELCRRDLAGTLVLGSYFATDPAGGEETPLTVVFGTFSPDGQSLVSVAHDAEHKRSEVRLWNLATNRAGRSFSCADLLGSRARMSPDGRVLAVRGIAKTGGPALVRLWTTATGEERATLRRKDHDIAALAFGPDGDWIVTRGKEGTTRVWDTATGRERWHREGPAAAEADVAVRPDGKQIVSVGGSVQVFDAATGGVQTNSELGTLFRAVSAAFSSDGKWLALSGSRQGREAVQLWHPPSGRELLTLRDLGGQVFFSPDSRYLVALGSRAARVWDSRSGQTRTLAGLGPNAIHPDGRRVLLNREGRFEVRDLEAHPEYRVVADGGRIVVPGPNGRPGPKAAGVIPLSPLYGPPVLSGDGRRLAATYGDGRVRVWDLASAGEICSVPAPLSLSLALSHEGTRLATAGPKAGTLVVWDADTGAQRCTITGVGGATRLTFSPSGALLVAVTRTNRAELGVWETATGRHRFTLVGATAEDFLRLAIPRDEKQVFDFTPGREPAVRSWDLDTGRETARATPLPSGSLPMFSPDRKRFACYRRNEICVADAVSGAVLWTHRPDADRVNGMAFSPDGRRLAAACAKGGRVRVWETETGQELLTLAAHAQYADAVRFGPDARSLFTLGLEATAAGANAVKRWGGPNRP